MKAAVVTFPGSNCDDDCVYALSKNSGFDTQLIFHKDSPDLSQYDIVVLPGGFSYGDYLRCGAMAALSPIMHKVKEFAAKGRPVLGICNGFQILCESGLLPGALAKNDSLKFSCKDVALKIENNQSPWTSDFKANEEILLPIAHGDGRYIITEEEYKTLKSNQQILLTYLDNPNGSLYNIAGIMNIEKNVFGLMPHPERATDLRSGHGQKVWNSIIGFIKQK